MDPFTEKQMLDILKTMAAGLNGIRAELADINETVHELAEAQYEYEDENGDEGDTPFTNPEGEE